jgi:hypothetical protein
MEVLGNLGHFLLDSSGNSRTVVHKSPYRVQAYQTK